MSIPQPVKQLFARFPLRTYPADEAKTKPVHRPTLWINPPLKPNQVLSCDVECVKWQAYIALRGLSDVAIRADIDPQGGIGARLPNLHLPKSDSAAFVLENTGVTKISDGKSYLVAAQYIPSWVDAKLKQNSLDDSLEGYQDEAAKDESREWVSLLEKDVHTALVLSQPTPGWLTSVVSFPTDKHVAARSQEPKASVGPLHGLRTLVLPLSSKVNDKEIETKFLEGIRALSERLGTDRWILGSSAPTPLDALLFAYLHCLLQSKFAHIIHQHVNLLTWEKRVREIVHKAFAS